MIFILVVKGTLAYQNKKILDVGMKMEIEAVNLTSALKGDTQ